MDFTTTFGGLDGLSDGISNAPALVHKELRTAMTKAVLVLEAMVKERTPTAYGTLRNSIYNEVSAAPDGIGVEGIVASSLSYAAYVELGTKPHLPPVDPLIDWAKKKLGLEEGDAVSAGYAIRATIAQRGTLGVGMFNTSLTALQPKIDGYFERAVANVAAAMLGGGNA